MSDLTDFLLARITEETDMEVAERVNQLGDGLSEAQCAAWAAAYEKTLEAQLLRVRGAFRQVGWAIGVHLPLFRREAKVRALRHADHPDYREEWKP